MNYKEAQKLKVGQRVMWAGNAKDLGTVSEVGAYMVRITWDNGVPGTIDLQDMDQVSVAP